MSGAVRFANAHLDAERDANVCGTLCVNAHLRRDEAVTKMGHPAFSAVQASQNAEVSPLPLVGRNDRLWGGACSESASLHLH